MPSQAAPDPLAQLPHEILCMIADRLDSASLYALIQTCRYYFDSFHSKLYVNSIGKNGFTPSLLYAALKGALATAQYALDAGASPGVIYAHMTVRRMAKNFCDGLVALDCHTQTALTIATCLGYVEVVDVLLPKVDACLSGISSVSLGDMSAAYYVMLQAACYDHPTILERLAKVPAFNINETEGSGNNLLRAICGGPERDNTQTIKFLLDSLTEPGGLGAQDQTALDAAVMAGALPTVQLLVESGKFKLNRQNSQGRTAFHLAVEFENDECTKYLLSRADIDPNISDMDGVSPTLHALLCDRTTTAELLIASPKVRFRGSEAFAIACKKRQDKVARLLLSSSDISKDPDETGKTWLHIAAEKNSPTGMTDLLKRKDMPLNAQCADGMTAIAYSISTRSVAATNRLLKNKPNADVTIANNQGWTPLHFACRETQATPLIESLLSFSANVNAAAADGRTPLHIACEKGSLKVVQVLLQAGANAVAETKDGVTPLHVACSYRLEQIVKLLCTYVPKKHKSLVQGRTPLHVACEVGHTEISKHLLQLGAAASLRDPMTGKTPIATACRVGCPIIIDELVKRKADPNEMDEGGFSLLHKSCHPSHPMTATKLMKLGADFNLRAPDGYLPIHIACKNSLPMVVRAMIKHGVDVNATGPDGVTPLIIASRRTEYGSSKELLEVLIKAGAKVDATRTDGKGPLHLACEGRLMPPNISILLKAGADPLAMMQDKPCEYNTPLQLLCQRMNDERPDMPDIFQEMLEHCQRPLKEVFSTGWSPLHVASSVCNAYAVNLLLKLGLDPRALTDVGESPLHRAVQSQNRRKQLEVIKLLLKAGADVNHKADTGRTVLWEAICNHADTKVENLLRKHGAIS